MAKRSGFDLGAAVVNRDSHNGQQAQQVRQSNNIQHEAKRKTMWFTAADRALLDELRRAMLLERGENISEIEVVRAGLLALQKQRG